MLGTDVRKIKHEMRRKALESDISDLTDEEHNYDERKEKKAAARQKLDELVRNGFGQSKQAQRLRREIRAYQGNDSESSYDSHASRIEFWKDINTKDDKYKNAVLMKR